MKIAIVSVPNSLRLGFAEPPPSKREAFGGNPVLEAPSLRELAGRKARLRELFHEGLNR